MHARRRIAVTGILLLVLTVIVLAGCYLLGQPTVSRVLCQAGLPNPTLPHRYAGVGFPGAGSKARCAVFHRVRALQGVWISRFERSSFSRGRFIEDAMVREGLDAEAWFDMDEAADPDGLLARSGASSGDGRGLLITFDGWVSEPAGGFGHLGGYGRLVLVDRLLKAERAPTPSEADFERWTRMLKQRN